MLHEDAELKISTAELLPIASNLLKIRFAADLNLLDPIILKNKYTGRKVCVEYHQFVLCAKSEKLEVTNIHARLMDKQKNFIIYFADASQFIWFQRHLINTSGYQNFRIDLKNNLKIPMWNFKVALGEELRTWLDDQVEEDLPWWQD